MSQKQITVTGDLWKAIKDHVPKSNYNSVSALSSYIINKYLEEKKKQEIAIRNATSDKK